MKNNTYKFVTMFLIAGLCVNTLPAQPQQAAPVVVPAPPPPPDKSAQAEAPRHAIRSSTDLVRIDVEVTDRGGKAIKGLHADQFTLTDNGKPQNISNFSYSDIEKIDMAGPDNSKPIVVPVDNPVTSSPEATDAVIDQVRDRRMIVLFFDMTSMQSDDLIRAHDAAKKYIETQMTPADLVSVVIFSTNLAILANFTNDRAVLQKAVAQIMPGAASQLGTPLYAAAQNGEYDVQQYTSAAYTADETEFNVFNTDQKLAAIEGMANVLAGIPGRKALVQFSGGITQTGEENRTQLQAATDAANRADVSIYSIDSRGLFATPPGGDATVNAASGTSMFTGAAVFKQTDQREGSRNTLATLSTDTGGRAFFDLGDLSDAFPKIQQENGGYYLVGYSLPADVKHDGRWRTIHVKVNVPGAHIRYRLGYYAPRDFQHLEKESREAQLADAINSAFPIVDLPIAVETTMFRLNDQQTYVPISAKISASALDWAQKHDRHEANFDFAAEVRVLPSKHPVAQLQDTIQVKLNQEKFEQVTHSNLLYQGGVVLAPGNYRLKFVARENESGKIGTFEENLTIPASQPTHLTLSSVMLSSQLVPSEKSNEVQTKGQGARAKVASPLDMGGEKIVPSVTRFFTKQQTLYVFFQAYYPEKAGSFDSSMLRAGLVFFREGLQINATPMIAPAQIDSDTHTASFRISLPLAELPSGRYTVQAVVIGAGTQHSAFGRTYLALEQSPVAPAAAAPAPSTPSTPEAAPPKPPSH